VLSRITSRPLRWLCYGAAVFSVLAIGSSRVYLGMHYPTDVLGGYVAAVFWLSVVYLFWRRRDGNRAL
jgi:undecaprenyl-diphosphatase